jgi:hypothetical protein
MSDDNGTTIGPTYKAIGAFFGVTGMALLGWRLVGRGGCYPVTALEVTTLGLPLACCIILLRPRWADNAVKYLAGRFGKYQQPER